MTEVAGSAAKRPRIGVFDSGFGGLTVLRELLRTLPGADYIYLGDTAHLPYGSKSQAAVTRFTDAAIRHLTGLGAELVVIACNTASALALPSLEADAPVPLVGVIGPGAAAAAAIVPAGSNVLVLATEGTCNSHAYTAACAERGLKAVEKPCPLFVPLVEEGWVAGPVPEQVADVYLQEALAESAQVPAAIVLGCTHYPLLRTLIEERAKTLAGPVPVVDSAEATAKYTAELLAAAAGTGEPGLRVLATDAAEKFQRFAPRFLGREIPAVELITLE